MADSPIRTVALDTIGCKLNQAETEALAREFALAGYRLVPAGGQADVYVLNTCTVTHIADRKCRQRLRLARRRNPGALVVATGCYAQRAGRELVATAGVDLVVDNEQKRRLVSLVVEVGGQGDSIPLPGHPATGRGGILPDRSRVKVQDGCNNFCTYCIVPLVRGGEKSVPLEQIVAEVGDRVIGGCQEVVLTGTEVGSYRYEGVDLPGMLRAVLAGTGVGRLRLSSLQPREISPELIELWTDTRLCPHFHLPLQSGSDGVLGRMNRRYTAADYRRAVSSIRRSLPGAAITTDIIVGFPGETEDEFEESCLFCRQMEFARIHVFPYSPRPGTGAARMRPTVAEKVKRQRVEQMLRLAGESAGVFRQQFVGETHTVLWEKRSARGVWSGLTGNYIRVYTRSDRELGNRLTPVKLVSVGEDGVWGEIGNEA